MTFLKTVTFLTLSFFTSTSFRVLDKIVIRGYTQGTTYQVTYFEKDSVVKKIEIETLLKQIDSSLSLYKPNSLVNQFNQSETGIETDIFFNDIVRKSVETYKTTNGLFDITIGPLTTAWGFGAKKISNVPDSAMVLDLLKCVNTDYINWDGKKWQKLKPCVQLDPNGIAQGYSVDFIADYLEKKGIKNYIVEIGGEIRVKGHKPDGALMTVAIESPKTDDYGIHLQQKILTLAEGAITTSGNYRRYYESNGKKISHILNPKTGFTQSNELISVTVFAKNALTADAYDNALMLMGLEKAIAFANENQEIEAYFIYNFNGKICDTTSAGFYNSLKQN